MPRADLLGNSSYNRIVRLPSFLRIATWFMVKQAIFEQAGKKKGQSCDRPFPV